MLPWSCDCNRKVTGTASQSSCKTLGSLLQFSLQTVSVREVEQSLPQSSLCGYVRWLEQYAYCTIYLLLLFHPFGFLPYPFVGLFSRIPP